MTKQKEFNKSVTKNDIIRFKSLLNDPEVNPAGTRNWAIQCSAENGFIEITEILLKHPKVDPSDIDNWAIGIASQDG
jgi:hypothetical protein